MILNIPYNKYHSLNSEQYVCDVCDVTELNESTIVIVKK